MHFRNNKKKHDVLPFDNLLLVFQKYDVAGSIIGSSKDGRAISKK